MNWTVKTPNSEAATGRSTLRPVPPSKRTPCLVSAMQAELERDLDRCRRAAWQEAVAVAEGDDELALAQVGLEAGVVGAELDAVREGRRSRGASRLLVPKTRKGLPSSRLRVRHRCRSRGCPGRSARKSGIARSQKRKKSENAPFAPMSVV